MMHSGGSQRDPEACRKKKQMCKAKVGLTQEQAICSKHTEARSMAFFSVSARKNPAVLCHGIRRLVEI
jgi:hypothetical protein